MNAIQPEVISHPSTGLITKKEVRKLLGIKTRQTFIKDYKCLELNLTHFSWSEIKQLLALRLFLSKGKAGIYGRELYSKLLEKYSPENILDSIGIDLTKEFKELKKQWNYSKN
ncbi:MAG: hypothetical protein SWX82_35490 [Cyanobacteriota bacterium]|nr:hypothetical protein [Cyanobacteriota bacterium]